MQSHQVEAIASAVPIPLVALNMPLSEVRETSLRMDIHGVQVYQAAMQLYETMLHELHSDGQFLRSEERRLPRETVAKVLQTDAYSRLAEDWAKLRG